MSMAQMTIPSTVSPLGPLAQEVVRHTLSLLSFSSCDQGQTYIISLAMFEVVYG